MIGREAFFSTRIDPRRVAVVTLAGAAAFLILGFGSLYRGVFAAAFALASLWLYLSIRERVIRAAQHLNPEAPSFRIFVPGSIDTLAVCGVLAAVLSSPLIFFGVRIFQSQPDSGPRFNPAILLLFAISAVTVTMLDLILWRMIRAIPFLIAGDSDEIKASFIGSRITLNTKDLRIRKVYRLHRDLLAGVCVVTDKQDYFIQSFGRSPEAQIVLASFAEWGRIRGVAVDEIEQILAPAPLRGWMISLGQIPTTCLILFAASPLVWTFGFWLRWLQYGPLSIGLSLAVLPGIGWTCGMAAVFSPLRRGLERWLARGGLSFSKPDGVCVTFGDLSQGIAGYAHSAKEGKLELDGDDLLLEAGGSRWRIQRSAVHSIRLHEVGETLKWADDHGRLFKRSTELEWIDGDGQTHVIALASRGDSFAPRNLRADSKLYAALTAWREGDTGAISNAAIPPTTMFWPLLAAAYLLLGFASPLVHQHIVETKLRTGEWRPPSWIQPHSSLSRRVHTLEAMPPPPWLLTETKPSLGLSEWPRTWIGDPLQKNFRAAGDTLSLVHAASHPQTHILRQIIGVGLDSFPLLPNAHDESSRNQKYVTSVTTGRSTQVLRGQFLSMDSATLHGGEKIFVVTQGYAPGLSLYWMGVERNESHFIRQLPASDMHSSSFFPSGRRVFVGLHVVDLESRNAVAAQLPEETEPDPWKRVYPNTPGYLFTFNAGDRLRIRVPYSYRMETREHIWEIDPDTAKIDVIAKFPETVHLRSADGDRWLLTERTPGEDDLLLLLYDAKTQTRKPLWREEADADIFLIAGTNRIVRNSEKSGWSEKSFDP